jgi:hypothetical protein
MDRFSYKKGLAASLILAKALYLILIIFGIWRWPTLTSEDLLPPRQKAVPGERLTLVSHFASYDAEFYLSLSENGYKTGQPQCAFYPLYPMVIRTVSSLTRLNDVLVGVILSNIFSLLAFLGFYDLCARRFGDRTATLAVVLNFTFPGSLFFQFIYTESLFLFLCILFFQGMERKRIWLIVVSGFLLPLTRAVGIFCVFPLVWWLYFQSPRNWGTIAARFGRTSATTRLPLEFNESDNLPRVLLITMPLAGLSVYFGLMWRWTGNPFEGFDAQKYWGVESVANLVDPIGFMMKFASPSNWHEFNGSMLDRCVFVLVVYCLPVVWKLDKCWCVWMLFSGIVPAISGGFTSYTRFVSVVFPVFIALATVLSNPRRRLLRWVTIGTFVALQIVLVWRFVNYKWAG